MPPTVCLRGGRQFESEGYHVEGGKEGRGGRRGPRLSSLRDAWHGLDSVGTRVCETPQLVFPSRILRLRKPPGFPLPHPHASLWSHSALSKNMSDLQPSPTMMTTRLASAPGGDLTGSRPDGGNVSQEEPGVKDIWL